MKRRGGNFLPANRGDHPTLERNRLFRIGQFFLGNPSHFHQLFHSAFGVQQSGNLDKMRHVAEESEQVGQKYLLLFPRSGIDENVNRFLAFLCRVFTNLGCAESIGENFSQSAERNLLALFVVEAHLLLCVGCQNVIRFSNVGHGRVSRKWVKGVVKRPAWDTIQGRTFCIGLFLVGGLLDLFVSRSPMPPVYQLKVFVSTLLTAQLSDVIMVIGTWRRGAQSGKLGKMVILARFGNYGDPAGLRTLHKKERVGKPSNLAKSSKKLRKYKRRKKDGLSTIPPRVIQLLQLNSVVQSRLYHHKTIVSNASAFQESKANTIRNHKRALFIIFGAEDMQVCLPKC